MDKNIAKALKQKAHHLKPVIIVGQKSLSDSVMNEINVALDHHELIKIRVNADDRGQRNQMIQEICRKTGSELIQRVGHIAAVYRESVK
ncbi:MAG TPA: YhbY family RNA-binding protein [Chromatiaceae bacterium]|jgi:RNA-binding protein|nr:YhbY family RNA-binding protein [Chromatiaceae bacterium]HIN81515.1 YhbY family RNA-binding protein [Chromatiales bacterium]HIA07650.1 YhbY family RNA-binding protein [Chromatiaceae bacterium]HIB84145.1 YhbY family RNA-binding protein [Chromatiaceae bacterium]HIO14286.1 YhbY family RNA-binding protein [Chromatiales bacterium]